MGALFAQLELRFRQVAAKLLGEPNETPEPGLLLDPTDEIGR